MCLRWNMENLCSECEHALNSLISVWATLQRFVVWHNLVWPIQYNIAIIIIMIVVVVCYRLLSTCSMSFFPSDAKLDIYLHSKTQAGFFYIFYYIGCKRFRYFWIYILFCIFFFLFVDVLNVVASNDDITLDRQSCISPRSWKFADNSLQARPIERSLFLFSG